MFVSVLVNTASVWRKLIFHSWFISVCLFVWVLWHINLCRLFNAKSILYKSSSSSCLSAGTDLPEPLSPPVSIVHCSWKVFKATSCIDTELLYIGSRWSSSLCSSMWKGFTGVYHLWVRPYFSSQQCSACLVHLTLIVFVMGGRWPYRSCFVGCLLQDLFNVARNILV